MRVFFDTPIHHSFCVLTFVILGLLSFFILISFVIMEHIGIVVRMSVSDYRG